MRMVGLLVAVIFLLLVVYASFFQEVPVYRADGQTPDGTLAGEELVAASIYQSVARHTNTGVLILKEELANDGRSTNGAAPAPDCPT
jgi:hypothetical protein